MRLLSSLPVPGLDMRTLYLFPSRLHKSLAFAAAIGLSMPLAAVAQGALGGPGGREGESSWGLGAAAISAQKAYAGMGRETRALPMLSYESRWFRFGGLGAEVKLPPLEISSTQAIDFRLVGKFDRSGYEADDAPILNGMAERKGGFWAGARATWRGDIAQLNAEWTADASNHSKGRRFSLSLERNWRLGQHVMVAPRLGAAWVAKKYVDYYFGVRGNEVTAARAAYSGKSAVNAELGLRATYLVDPHNSLFLDVGVTSLGKEIKNSPLVDRSTENRVFVGYLYRF
jgi:outer membrane protein